MAPFLDPTLRGDNGDVGIIRSPVRAIVLPDKLSIVAMPTLLVWRKAASGRPILQGRSGVAGVPSPGHASKGIPQEPKRAPHLLPHREERLSHREVRDPKGDRRDTEGCRAV